MGVFLQTALFPGCDEIVVRATMESVAKVRILTLTWKNADIFNPPRGHKF